MNLVNKQGTLASAYRKYSKDIGEEMELFDIVDRVEHLSKTNPELFEQEYKFLQEKGYIK